MFDWLASKFRRKASAAGVGLAPHGLVLTGEPPAPAPSFPEPAPNTDPIVWEATVPMAEEQGGLPGDVPGDLPGAVPGGARDESERRSLALLQARGLSALQYVAETAARICETPLAAVAMADSETVWFQAMVGAQMTQLPRAGSFCDHAIKGMPAVLVVPDTREDARFDALALVTAAPHIRFYAGAPFATADGVSMGAVSVADITPRELTPVQLRTLELLARQTVMLLDARMRNQTARPA